MNTEPTLGPSAPRVFAQTTHSFSGETPRQRVVLHIGQPKTGTSVLQEFLHLNRSALRDRGFIYPEAPPDAEYPRKQSFLVKGAILRRYRDRTQALWEDVLKEFQSSQAHTLIISDEVLWEVYPRRPEERSVLTAWIAQRLRDFQVQVLCYLRPQSEWVESRYNQRMKGPVGRISTLSFPDFLAHHEDHGSLDYRNVLEAWACSFGQQAVRVRSFERAQLVQGDIVDDFCEQLGIPTDATLQRPPQLQVRLETPAAAMALAFNRQEGAAAHKGWFIHLLRELEPMARADHSLMSDEQAQALDEKYAESNRAIARTYQQRDRLFLREERRPKAQFDCLRPEELAEVLARVTLWQKTRVDELQARVQALEAGRPMTKLPPASPRPERHGVSERDASPDLRRR